MIDERKIPSAIEAEQGVIGGVFVEPGAWSECSDLTATDFLLPAHQAIWQAVRSMTARGMPIDVLLVLDALTASGDLGKLEGGASYLMALGGSGGVSWNVAHYAAKVRDVAAKRRLLVALGEITSRIYQGDDDAATLAQAAREAIDKSSVAVGSLTSFKDLSDALTSEIERRAAAGETFVTGARFGIEKLDNLTAGLQPGWLTIVAAETGGGKTALAMQAAINVVLSGGTALACNLEMTKVELAERALVHVAELNSQLVRTGQIAPDDWAKIHKAAASLYETRFFFEDATTSVSAIASKARLWRSRNRDGKGLLVVDFVQLIRCSRERGQSRAQEVGVIAQDFKALAKELGVPVILISQLNRAGVKADRPSKSDLKESGDLENAADLILLPWNRDGVADGEVAIIVDKFRSGERITIPARWVGRHYRFAASEYQNWQEAFDGAS